jgi:hypothetical protein
LLKNCYFLSRKTAHSTPSSSSVKKICSPETLESASLAASGPGRKSGSFRYPISTGAGHLERLRQQLSTKKVSRLYATS